MALVNPYIRVFTDGACKNNGKKNAKGGFGIYIDTNLNFIETRTFSQPVDNPTNNRCELLGIVMGLYIIYRHLKTIIKLNPDVFISVEDIDISLYTDSKYSYDCAVKWINNWKKRGWVKSNGEKVKNIDLLRDLDKYTKLIIVHNHKGIKFHHVRSHKPEPKCSKNKDEYRIWFGNDLADRLANHGVEMKNENEDEMELTDKELKYIGVSRETFERYKKNT